LTVARAALAAALLLLACTRDNPAFRPPVPEAGVSDIADAPAPADPDVPVDSPPDLPTPDAASPDTRDAASEAAPGTRCGTEHLDVSTISGADGIAIDPDGTLYFTSDDGTHGWVGRMTGSTITRQWLRIDFGPLTAGLALDRSGKKLYVASVSGEAILEFDLAANPVTGRTVLTGVPLINDLAFGAPGRLYYSRQSDRHVYFLAGGVTTRVSGATLGAAVDDEAPAGLAFAPDGALTVGLRKGGEIFRLGLAPDGREDSRSVVPGLADAWGNGLAFDEAGRLYVADYDDVADRTVIRVAAGQRATVATGGRFASLAFGRGTLDCKDLYVAAPSGPMRRIATDTAGFYPP
jgi:sugar lactone lactonase YvrE